MKRFYSWNHQNSCIKGDFSLHSDSQKKIAPTVVDPHLGDLGAGGWGRGPVRLLRDEGLGDAGRHEAHAGLQRVRRAELQGRLHILLLSRHFQRLCCVCLRLADCYFPETEMERLKVVFLSLPEVYYTFLCCQFGGGLACFWKNFLAFVQLCFQHI